jgi:hypothetical protein
LALPLAFLVFYPIQRLLHRHLQGMLALLFRNADAALILYAVMLLPGVALHEASHWLAAKLLRVPTSRFSLLPTRSKGKTIRFGYVVTKQVDPFRSSLIGIAPLVMGMAALSFLGLEHLGLRQLPEMLGSGDVEGAITALNGLASTPELFLWIYLIFAISNTMLPSSSDRSSWLAAITLMAAGVAILFALGLSGQIAGPLAQVMRALLPELSSVFLIAAGVDLVLLVPILVVELILGRLLGWEIVYS